MALLPFVEDCSIWSDGPLWKLGGEHSSSERKKKVERKKYKQSSEERKYESKLVITECFKGQDKYKFLNEGI